MAIRFRKSISLFKGVRLNVGKTGTVSVGVGKRGASLNVGSKGVHSNIGIPETGLSYRSKLSGNSKSTITNQDDSEADKLTLKERKQIEFNKFATELQSRYNCMIGGMFAIRGFDFYNRADVEILKQNPPTDALFTEYLQLQQQIHNNIDEINLSGQQGQREKNKLTKDFLIFKKWIDKNYPDWEPQNKKVETNYQIKEQEIQRLLREADKIEQQRKAKEKFDKEVIIACVLIIVAIGIFLLFQIFK